MVCINTQKREFQIIDFTVSSDQRAGNIEKEQDLRIKLQKVLNVKAVVIPVVIGALETMSKTIYQYIKQIDIQVDIITTQKRDGIA